MIMVVNNNIFYLEQCVFLNPSFFIKGDGKMYINLSVPFSFMVFLFIICVSFLFVSQFVYVIIVLSRL